MMTETESNAIADSITLDLNVFDDDGDAYDQVSTEIIIVRHGDAEGLLDARPELADWTRSPLIAAVGFEVWTRPGIRMDADGD